MELDGISEKIIEANLKFESIKNDLYSKDYSGVAENKVKHFLISQLNQILAEVLVLADMATEFENADSFEKLEMLLREYDETHQKVFN